MICVRVFASVFVRFCMQSQASISVGMQPMSESIGMRPIVSSFSREVRFLCFACSPFFLFFSNHGWRRGWSEKLQDRKMEDPDVSFSSILLFCCRMFADLRRRREKNVSWESNSISKCAEKKFPHLFHVHLAPAFFQEINENHKETHSAGRGFQVKNEM